MKLSYITDHESADFQSAEREASGETPTPVPDSDFPSAMTVLQQINTAKKNAQAKKDAPRKRQLSVKAFHLM
jgi:hypothetical protein